MEHLRANKFNKHNIGFEIDEYLILPICIEEEQVYGFLGFIGQNNITLKDDKTIEILLKMLYKYKQNKEIKLKFKEIFENIGTALVIMDFDGLILEVNKEFEEFTGYSQQEVEGKMNFIEFVFPEDKEIALEFHNKNLIDSRENVEKYEIKFIDKSKNIKYALNTSRVLRDNNIIIVSLTDITDEKIKENKLLEYVKRYESLFKNNNTVMLVIDPKDGKVVDVNDAAIKFYGYSKEEFLNLTFYDLNYLNKDEFLKIIEKLRRDKINNYNFKHKLSNGEIKDVEVSTGRIQFDENLFLYFIINDITEKTKIEDESIKLLQSIVETLSSIVEVRDPYTAGHQGRVAKLSVAIAEEMNLDSDQIEVVKIAALLHDIGKIKIPSELLTKPGLLSKNEFELIKEHAMATFEILSKINFKNPIAKIASQHHERIDGSGYPVGLKDGEILLESRILAVADVVEAMSSHRPYRPALGVDVALNEIVRYSGVKFDEEAVTACVRLFKEKNFKFE